MKALAYQESDKLCEARQWAAVLQQTLIEAGLLVDNRPRTGHNNAQPENITTTTTKGDRQ